jgi:hypothetical protein
MIELLIVLAVDETGVGFFKWLVPEPARFPTSKPLHYTEKTDPRNPFPIFTSVICHRSVP